MNCIITFQQLAQGYKSVYSTTEPEALRLGNREAKSSRILNSVSTSRRQQSSPSTSFR